MEVLSLLSDDVETDDAEPGENLKLRLKGIEEEEILPGFILCNAENLCHSGRTFDAQVSARGRSAGITGPIDTTFTAKRYVYDDWACIETTCTAAVHVVRNESQAWCHKTVVDVNSEKMLSWSPELFPLQIVIIEHKSIICPGYNAVLHIHTCIEEVQITVKPDARFTFSMVLSPDSFL